MHASTAIILDERYERKDGTFAVKLRVTHNRRQVYYPLNIQLSKDSWQKSQQPNPKGEHKQNKLLFNRVEQRAVEIVRGMNNFDFANFEALFIGKTNSSPKDVFSYFQDYILQLSNEGRIGTSESYSNAYNSIKKFIGDKRRKVLLFEMVDVTFLKDYENWMLAKGNSSTTVGIYTRSLRTILNLAIENGDMKKEDYPFNKRKYQIPASINVKKALKKEEIKKILEYNCENTKEEWSRDMWLLSYLSNGANIKDLSLLKIKGLSNTSIQFVRSKTERSTKQELKPIVVMRIAKINDILTKWGNLNRGSEEYVFDIVKTNMTPLQVRSRVKQATKTINKYIKKIGSRVGIDIELTTYTARHSFATVLKRSGASTEFISESLGHKDKKTTENYLDSFEDEMKIIYQNKLLKFD